MSSSPISQHMTHDVFAVPPDAALEAVARLCTRRHISGVPVVEPDGVVVGVVATYDLIDPDRRHCDRLGAGIAFRVRDGQRETIDVGPVTQPGLVSDVMTAFVRSVSHDTPLDEAVQLMLSDDIHRLVVLDDARHLIGMFTSTDAMRALVQGRPI